MRRDRNPWLDATAIAFFVFLYLQIAILILFSFNDSKRNFLWRGFTLKWYPTLFGNDALIQALTVSVQVALISVVVATVPGRCWPGIAPSARARLRCVGHAAPAPMVTPEIVMGVSLLFFFAQLIGVMARSGRSRSPT
jgi:spermidine/putrescine transport system permease protein